MRFLPFLFFYCFLHEAAVSVLITVELTAGKENICFHVRALKNGSDITKDTDGESTCKRRFLFKKIFIFMHLVLKIAVVLSNAKHAEFTVNTKYMLVSIQVYSSLTKVVVTMDSRAKPV